MQFQNFSVIPMSLSQPKFMSTMTLKPCVPTYLLLILRYMCRQSVVKGFFPYLIRKRKHPTNRIIKAFVGCLSGWASLAALIPFANSCLLWCGPENGLTSILHTFYPLFEVRISLILTKKEPPQKWKLFFGWAGGIRTHGMQESKSCALPLGDSPIDIEKRLLSFHKSLFSWGG